MTKLIVVRHGQSQWNLENRFTGWVDVDLTEKGRAEAVAAAQRLISADLSSIDIAFTSCLTRAIRTLWIILDQLGLMWIDVHRHWQLNERHYGSLQGLNKSDTAKKYGDEQVHIWRRSYDTPPDALSIDSPMYSGNDPRYQHVDASMLPRTESLKQVHDRIVPLWQSTMASHIEEGKQILVVAHGNSLRALVMYLTGMTPQQVMDFNIDTGVPLVLEMDGANRAGDMHFLD